MTLYLFNAELLQIGLFLMGIFAGILFAKGIY